MTELTHNNRTSPKIAIRAMNSKKEQHRYELIKIVIKTRHELKYRQERIDYNIYAEYAKNYYLVKEK